MILVNQEVIKVGPIQTNCYILEKENMVLVIDPGDEYEKINRVINGKKVVGVIITHHHYDHVGALNYFDESLIYDYSNLKEGKNTIDPFEFEVIYTPGHKSDAITIYFKEFKKMFTGDFLFKNTIGRTDLPTSSVEEMNESLKKIFKYEDDIEVYPGHGSSTNLGIEKNNNHFE